MANGPFQAESVYYALSLDKNGEISDSLIPKKGLVMTIAIVKSNSKPLKYLSTKKKINRKLAVALFKNNDLPQLSDSELIKIVLRQVSELENEQTGSRRKSLNILNSGKASNDQKIQLLLDSFASIGMVARKVLLWGQQEQHCACEVWSDFYKKWIFADPINGIYATHKGKPLSFYAIWAIKNADLLSEVEFVSVIEKDLDFGSFYGQFMNYISVGDKVQMALFLDQKEQFCSDQFQMSFVSSPHELYYSINRVSVEHQLAASQVRYKLNNNMPWFSFYELYDSSKEQWCRVKAEFVSDNGKELQIRSSNKAGRRGQITKVLFVD